MSFWFLPFLIETEIVHIEKYKGLETSFPAGQRLFFFEHNTYRSAHLTEFDAAVQK